MENTIETFKNLLGAFSDFSFSTFFTQTLPKGLGNTLSLGIVVLVVFGIVECLFGWQLLRFELMLGAFSGVLGVAAIISQSTAAQGIIETYQIDDWMIQAALIVVSLVAAIFTWYHANLAFFLAMMAVSGWAIYQVLSGAMGNVMVAAAIAGVLSIPVAFLLKQILMPLVVSLTSIGGAMLVALSISGFLNNFLPSIGIMLLTDLTVTGLIFQVRRLLKNKVNGFMRTTMRSTNSFLARYEGDVTSISRNFFSRLGL